MIAKLPGPRSDGRGRSFKALAGYILHDKGRARTARRVAWAEPVNCGLGGSIRRAWYEMLLTWENRAALKRAAGIALTGRDNERPVLHLTLSWHPDQSPDRAEMMAAALDALDWLGLAEHQAIVAAHSDEPQPHVHIAVNTVHPVTGRTANLYQSKKALSAWAMHWEETHGGLIVEGRKKAIPAATAPQPAAPLDRMPMTPVPVRPATTAHRPPLAPSRAPAEANAAGTTFALLVRLFRAAVLWPRRPPQAPPAASRFQHRRPPPRRSLSP